MAANSKAKKPVKISFSERAYVDIKQRILDNEFPAGHQLMEAEIGELLEISRTPVREAMMRLESEGLVEVRPRHGMTVKPISVSDMREIYAVLTGLESTAAYQAAQRHLPESDIAALRQALEEMNAALKADDLKAWASADANFHRLLVSMSDNSRLIQLVDRFMDQVQRVRLLTLKLRPKPTQSNKDHSRVVDAIEARDAEAAREIHRKHRENAGKLLVDLLESHGLTQL